jgi:uncharacterized protein YjbJ (UPF0337 family)
MSIQSKVTGRLKQAAGDLAGDEKLRREGVREERKADAKRELSEAEEAAERKRAEVARLEYETGSGGDRGDGARSDPPPTERRDHDIAASSEPGAGAAADREYRSGR